MTRNELISLIHRKQSFLCVGLDSDITKIPVHLKDEPDPVFAFNKAIIDATLPFAVAYKPNLAFYESRGIAGWKSLEKTLEYLESFRSEVFTIADAKRGDIGNTSQHYALSVFSKAHSGLEFDAVTVAPYMGSDSVKPFMEFEGKWVILLALTSNQGSRDFQHLTMNENGFRLFEEVLKRSFEWGGTPENMMFVAGATQAHLFDDIRRIVPDHFLLVPGVGAQGGSLEEVARHGLNRDCGLLVNSSRGIIFASADSHFAEAAAEEAYKIQQQMARLLAAR
ncbi:MAG: orotidine-5-phosphate decarboxylase [Bacteroidales bacterium]|jgi:orotidine-5'-phosphate decarboxylase|nr:orotidine-5-phosphate decarboxylase [Bacteroidales bacterium]MDN5329231.1 orotidine-5-phosphate decarboxylase [Bacteroidales bacterium]